MLMPLELFCYGTRCARGCALRHAYCGKPFAVAVRCAWSHSGRTAPGPHAWPRRASSAKRVVPVRLDPTTDVKST